MREFTALDSALEAVASGPESTWMDRLEKVAALPLRSPEVKAVRDVCTAAYRRYGDALLALEAGKASIRALERDVHNRDAQAAARTQKRASAAVDAATRTLRDAERLVAECTRKRRALRAKLRAAGE